MFYLLQEKTQQPLLVLSANGSLLSNALFGASAFPFASPWKHNARHQTPSQCQPGPSRCRGGSQGYSTRCYEISICLPFKAPGRAETCQACSLENHCHPFQPFPSCPNFLLFRWEERRKKKSECRGGWILDLRKPVVKLFFQGPLKVHLFSSLEGTHSFIKPCSAAGTTSPSKRQTKVKHTLLSNRSQLSLVSPEKEKQRMGQSRR